MNDDDTPVDVLASDALDIASDMERDAYMSVARGEMKESKYAPFRDLVDLLSNLHHAADEEAMDERDAAEDVAQDWAELKYLCGLMFIAAGVPLGGGQRADLP